MSYLTHSVMSYDAYLVERIAACAASLKVPNPRSWASENALFLVSTPGWEEAYNQWTPSGQQEMEQGQLALTAGADESLVTDQMIKTAVEELLNPSSGHEVLIEQ